MTSQLAKTQVPAKRYDLFIQAFEKEVTKAQEAIKRMDSLQRPYEICRGFLEELKLENPTKLELRENGIYIRIDLMENDQKHFFDDIISRLGILLLNRGLHRDGIPTTILPVFDFDFTWRLSGFKDFPYPPRVKVTLDVPWNGTKYIQIETKKTQRMVEEEDRRLVWLEGPC